MSNTKNAYFSVASYYCHAGYLKSVQIRLKNYNFKLMSGILLSHVYQAKYYPH